MNANLIKSTEKKPKHQQFQDHYCDNILFYIICSVNNIQFKMDLNERICSMGDGVDEWIYELI